MKVITVKEQGIHGVWEQPGIEYFYFYLEACQDIEEWERKAERLLIGTFTCRRQYILYALPNTL